MELSTTRQVDFLNGPEIDPVTYLFLQLHNRRFIAMEMALLSLLEECLQGKHNAAHWLLHDFNRMYCAWLQSKKLAIEKECDDLRSLEHDNYLLAYCQGVAEMEEILLECNDFIKVYKTEHQKKLTRILINNYKRRYL